MNASTNIQRTPWRRSNVSSVLAALAAAALVGVGCLLLLVSIEKNAVAQVTQEQPPVFLTQWGTFGAGAGEFDDTTGVAVDSSGNVYVADHFNDRIQKFDSNGEFLTQWGSFGGGEGEFNQPYDVAVDSSGNVYVTDLLNNRIQKFDSNGGFLTQWGSFEGIPGAGEGEFYYPRGVAVDSSGNVYVADQINSRIQKFDSNGEFLTQWGGPGAGEGDLNTPLGVAVDSSGNVYVADSANNRIQKFSPSGEFVTQWGGLGSGEGQFQYPFGVDVDSSGNVYVADSANNRIQKFSPNHDFLTQWGQQGSDEGQFNYPYDVAVDSSGNVYVADTYNDRIQKFGVVAPPTVDLEGWADSGVSESDNITNITTPAFAGTAPAGSTVELFDGDTSLGEVSADEQDGSWSFEAPALGEGSHEITAIATDVEGRTSNPSDALEVKIDLTAPETTITSGPADFTNKTTATFEFSSNEANSIFMGILDEDSYEEVSSPATYTGLSNGGHTFKVRAEDLAGNIDASAESYSWEVDALKPTATAPVQTLKQDERLGTSLIPVSLEWSATDNTGGSGIALYELKQSKDGAPFTSVALADPTATSTTLNLERGSTYRYQVRAQDEAGNWSAWVAGPRFTVAAHQENSSAVSYSNGTWTRSALSGAYGGYVKYAKAQGATARLTFTGRNIAWVATKAPSRGTAEVYIDGTKVSTVDLYSATTQARTIAFSKEWSASNSHTITIKVLGAPTSRPTVDVDAFAVLQ